MSRLTTSLWAEAFSYLEPSDLYQCLQTSGQLHAAAKDKRVWKSLVAGKYLGVPDLPARWHDYWDLCREIHTINRGGKNELISAALMCTSVDTHGQSIHETVNAMVTSFWSSTGADDAHHCDSVMYLLSGSVSLVHSLQVHYPPPTLNTKKKHIPAMIKALFTHNTTEFF